MFILYNDDGEILAISSDQYGGNQSLARMEVEEGLVISPSTHRVSGEALVAYTAEQAAAKLARPHPTAAWSNATMSWADTRPIAELRADAVSRLKAARDEVIYGGFVWDGSTFDSDSESQQRLLGACYAASNGSLPSVGWRLADNSWRILSASDIASVYAALQQHMQAAFGTFAALEAAVQSAQTAESVGAIQWPTGS